MVAWLEGRQPVRRPRQPTLTRDHLDLSRPRLEPGRDRVDLVDEVAGNRLRVVSLVRLVVGLIVVELELERIRIATSRGMEEPSPEHRERLTHETKLDPSGQTHGIVATLPLEGSDECGGPVAQVGRLFVPAGPGQAGKLSLERIEQDTWVDGEADDEPVDRDPVLLSGHGAGTRARGNAELGGRAWPIA
jgi:hypothetical protein